jgi:hypothetical protein
MSDEDNSLDNENLKYLSWAGYLEDLIAKWSDNALSYAWLHNKAEAKYRKLNYSFTIPIVVLSTLTGTINVGMSSLFPADKIQYGQIAIGGLGIFTGILGTLQNFFKYAQLSEAHRNSAIQWHKFHRALKTELSLESICRRNAGEFFRSSKAELDRLLDSSPYIPSDVVQKYIAENDIDLPDVIGNLQKTLVFRGGIRMSPKKSSSPTQSLQGIQIEPNFIKINGDSPINRQNTFKNPSQYMKNFEDKVSSEINELEKLGNLANNIKNNIEKGVENIISDIEMSGLNKKNEQK